MGSPCQNVVRLHPFGCSALTATVAVPLYYITAPLLCLDAEALILYPFTHRPVFTDHVYSKGNLERFPPA